MLGLCAIRRELNGFMILQTTYLPILPGKTAAAVAVRILIESSTGDVFVVHKSIGMDFCAMQL